MTEFTTGRTLDSAGEPIPGTGFTVERGSWLAEKLAERTGPVTSHPTRPVWGVPLDGPEDVIRTLSVVGSGYGGPPEHYHERSPEVFDVARGELTLTLDGEARRVESGEAARVDTGVRHTFRNDSNERALVVTEIHSPGRLRSVLPTLGGLAHDDDRDPDHPLQRAAIATRLDGNTVFTESESLPGPLVDAAGAVARATGYRGAYATYTQPAFWRRHVEQPDAGA